MNIEPLLKIFDDLADAPERIPAIRKVILAYLLHSAVNSPDALPCAETLREAHDVRRRELIKSASRKNLPIIPDVVDEDLPPSLSDIPAVLFDRLGNIASIEKGLSQIQSTKPGIYPLVVTAETRSSSDSYDFEGAAAIVPLVSSTGHGDASLKRLHYQEGRYAVGNILAVVKPICPDLLRARFIYEYLTAFKEELLVARMVGTANVSLTVNKLKEVPVPLVSGPVLGRIDELMALCDQLEAQQQEREAKKADLARASLARFAEAPTPANLEFIFHKSYDITPADLRKSILTLAVQGKLVPQDPNDEPAGSVLAQIARKKQAMIDAKQVRQGKVSRPQSAHAAPAEVPPGWEWVNVDSLCFKVTDGTHFTPQYAATGVRFVSAKDIVSGKLVFDRCKFITQEEHEQLYRRCNPEYHDIVISKSGSIGTVALVEDRNEFSLFESLALLKFDQTCLFPSFLVYAFTYACASLTAGHIRGVGVKHLHLDMLRGLELALPPLAEQRRIVAKVDQLMALVDKLEMQLNESKAFAAKLLDAVAEELAA